MFREIKRKGEKVLTYFNFIFCSLPKKLSVWQWQSVHLNFPAKLQSQSIIKNQGLTWNDIVTKPIYKINLLLIRLSTLKGLRKSAQVHTYNEYFRNSLPLQQEVLQMNQVIDLKYLQRKSVTLCWHFTRRGWLATSRPYASDQCSPPTLDACTQIF